VGARQTGHLAGWQAYVAHRGVSAAKPIWKKDVHEFSTNVTRLIALTELAVAEFLETETGERIWLPGTSANG